ncbi:MAG TPA: MarR family transcriptional regulator [Frankiaceae bacterium]|jgi:DNA-binding MarR family transcriptional regulator|nr:MarR family transcriptional regulator [Frankiaceae bacterium]
METDAEKLAERLLEASSSLIRAARTAASEGAKRDVTMAQMELLRLVRRRPGITAADAATELRLARNTVSTLVGQLTGQDLLSRERDEFDGRIVRLRLMPAAQERMAAWRERRLRATTAAVQGLSAAERATIYDALAPLEVVVNGLRP